MLTTTYCITPNTYFSNALCIDNISIIDPELGLIEHQTVIIKEGKILQVLSSGKVNLSSKNRIIDGKDSVSFLKLLKENLEDPRKLFLDL